MKTKEEVKRHLLNVGYSKPARERICGFLVAKDLKDCNDVWPFKKGVLEFADFILWFNLELPPITTQELEYGDYVHVSDKENVIVITLMEDSNSFVGCDGREVGCYVLDKDSRMCTDEELAEVMQRMHENCLDFDYASCSLVPLSESALQDE